MLRLNEGPDIFDEKDNLNPEMLEDPNAMDGPYCIQEQGCVKILCCNF